MIHLILNLLNRFKKFKYFFLSPIPYAIGTASEQILIASKFAKLLKKKIIIIKIRSLDYKICNNSLFDDLEINKESLKMIKPLNYILTTILEIEFIIWRVFIFFNDKILKLKLHEYFRFSNIGVPNIFETNKTKNKNIILKKYEDIEKFKLENQSLSLNTQLEKKCKKILNQFITKRQNKIVCLHVRDGSYRNDFNRKNYRNSNIEKYNRAIRYLTDKGYFVIRLGDKHSKKTKVKNRYFFDYPFSKFRSEAMDLYLIKISKFYIGTQSGILDTAYMFNKPILTTMCELFCNCPRKKYDRGIFKKVFLKKNKKQVSILNFMSASYKYHNPDNENENFYFKENTENEIYLAVKEFEKNFKNKFKIKKSGIQKKFDRIHNDRYKNIFYEREDYQNSLINSVDSIKMIRMFKASSGTLCNSYLKNNL